MSWLHLCLKYKSDFKMLAFKLSRIYKSTNLINFRLILYNFDNILRNQIQKQVKLIKKF